MGELFATRNLLIFLLGILKRSSQIFAEDMELTLLQRAEGWWEGYFQNRALPERRGRPSRWKEVSRAQARMRDRARRLLESKSNFMLSEDTI